MGRRPPGPTRPDPLFPFTTPCRAEEAEAAFRAGDTDRASAVASRLPLARPDDARALLILGASALARHRPAEALPHTDRAIAEWDGDVPPALPHTRGYALGAPVRLAPATPSLAAHLEVGEHHRPYRRTEERRCGRGGVRTERTRWTP